MRIYRSRVRFYLLALLVRPFVYLYAFLLTNPVARRLLSRLGSRKAAARKRRAATTGGNPQYFTRENVFGGFTPEEKDVFVCTWCKSGTNWMLQIAYQICSRGEGDFNHVHDVIPWPDSPLNRTLNEAESITPYTRKQVIKTHLPSAEVPYSPAAKYISVIRDPKEVFVSSYHFVHSIAPPITPAVEKWLDMYLSGRFPLGFGTTWARHTAGYWAWKDRPNVLVLTFKELKHDYQRTLARVAKFLDVQLDDEQMQTIAEKCSFAYMKREDHKYHPDPYGFMPWSRKAVMIRSGQKGQSSELLTKEQQQRIDEHCRKELADLVSDFPYDESFVQAG